MPTIVSRSAANLPPVPSSISHRSLSSWAGIRVHHTGGAFSSWRAVHDWQTAGRPPGDRLAYIGYSFGIADGRVTELRGWDHHPAHDFINTHLGVVFGGSFGSRLPTAADLDAFVWFVGEAERRCGKRLPISTHREVGQTACPGDRLHRWVKQSLPDQLKEDDMSTVREVWLTDGIVRKPAGYEDSTNEFWAPANILRSAQYWSRRGALDISEVKATTKATHAAVVGQDLAEQLDQALAEHRAALLGELAGPFADAIAERLANVPADEVRAAVRAELAELRLVAEPAE